MLFGSDNDEDANDVSVKENTDETNGTAYDNNKIEADDRIKNGANSNNKNGANQTDTSKDALIALELYKTLNNTRSTRHGSQKPVKHRRRDRIAVSKDTPKRSPLNHPLQLSPALSQALGGETELSRPDVVKRIWSYIKDHNLQDPTNRRTILCDSLLRPVFGSKTDIIKMHKALSKHLYKPDEVQ